MSDGWFIWVSREPERLLLFYNDAINNDDRPNGAFSKSTKCGIEILECTAIYDDDDDYHLT